MNSLRNESGLQLLNKIPEVTLWFWLMKVMATTVGETVADFLNVSLNFGLTGTSVVMGILLAVFLFLQVRASEYVPWLYWLVVILISVVGTLITDNLVDNFGVALQTTSIIFGVVLLATFVVWYSFEKTLSIHSIFTSRRELFYWAAILFTFALGTAAGDLAAEGMALGYAKSALMFGGLIAATTVSYYLFRANAIAAFWIAYILTRPLGASCGDLLSQPVANGGLGLGTVVTSMLFLVSSAVFVIYLSVSRKREMAVVPINLEE
ncbi:MAG: hypothetical protein M0024_02975 [Nitrospiraceae bacterium]|nr:hypothetical protein [Nitrospiraceae bacterium]